MTSEYSAATDAVRDAARETAHRVGRTLRVPAHVAGIARRAHHGLPADLHLPGWQPASLLIGHPGIALLHTRLSLDEPAQAAVAHAHLATAAQDIGPRHTADLLLPARLHAAAHGGYTRLLAHGGDVLASVSEALVAAAAERTEPGLGYADYDVITGLTGKGRHLLAAAGQGNERCAHALTGVLDRLVSLTRPVETGGHRVPGWWCAPERYAVHRDLRMFPEGDFNLGAAHGISGPLSLLALAHGAGHRVDGMEEALRRIVDWLLARTRTDRWGPYWPGRIAFGEETGEETGGGIGGGVGRGAGGGAGPGTGVPDGAVPGWCYGTVGVARALYLAGQALDDASATAAATAAMTGLTRRPPDATVRADPAFCHGRAGVLHGLVRMAHATGDPALWEAADGLARGLTDGFDPAVPFGYTQHLRDLGEGPGVDNPGLLDGAAGIALALITYADARDGHRPPAEPDWDAAFVMS